MKVVDIEPGTSEWHTWRSQGIGASEIGVILGDDPYTTPYQLWEKKCGYAKPTPINEHMAWGIRNEDKARQWINSNEKIELKPICVEDEESRHFRASLDGWDVNQRILVEIKCPTTESTIDNARNHSAIHSYWYDQVQWQIMITQPDVAYVAIYDPRVQGCILLQQWPDLKLHKKMREKAQTFWNMVVKGTPPNLTDKDYKDIEDSELEVLLKNYELADLQCKEGTAKKKELRDVIYSYGGGDNFKAYGWAVRMQKGRVTYDYKKMEEDGIDLSLYEKVGSSSFTIKKLKEG